MHSPRLQNKHIFFLKISNTSLPDFNKCLFHLSIFLTISHQSHENCSKFRALSFSKIWHFCLYRLWKFHTENHYTRDMKHNKMCLNYCHHVGQKGPKNFCFAKFSVGEWLVYGATIQETLCDQYVTFWDFEKSSVSFRAKCGSSVLGLFNN